jgi:hypothetical protein
LVNGGCHPVPKGRELVPDGGILPEPALCWTPAGPEGEALEAMETSCVWRV